MKQTLRKVIRKIFPASHDTGNVSGNFVNVKDSEIKRREYSSYDEYLQHQGEKLLKRHEGIASYDLQYEKLLIERYQEKYSFKGTLVLCLAARLGGEVRAFKNLGAVAIGIDIEPGQKNEDVLYGDFHNIAFPDDSFDFLFTNAIDHAFDLEKLFAECHRVLKPNGTFLLEMALAKPGAYESIDTTNPDLVLNVAKRNFEVRLADTVEYNVEFVNWSGNLYELRRTT